MLLSLTAGLAALPPVKPGSAVVARKTAVTPKPLSTNVQTGLDWLAGHQHENGGWGQGEESQHMGSGMAAYKDKPNVADTCQAVLALIRSGSTPSSGSYAEPINKAIDFVLDEIEASDEKSLSITSVTGTRVQAKLGPHIDTFVASVVLAEVKGQMPDAASEARLAAGLDKVITKLETNQKGDGTWDMRGWAPALAQSMATKGLARGSAFGADVDGAVLLRSNASAKRAAPGKGFASAGTAGIALYGGASDLGTLQDSVNALKERRGELRDIIETSTDESEIAKAKLEDKEYEELEKARDLVQEKVLLRLDNRQFLAGFGSNGGEEFLSYMNIGEALVVNGGDDWKKWDADMTSNLNRIQNADGSWTGHHCITGRTFCTATALLVLMVDRTPFTEEVLSKPADNGR